MVFNKIRSFTSILYNVRDFLPIHCRMSLYYSLIHSQIQYCVEVYASTYFSHLDKLVKINNKIIRILFKKDYYTKVDDLYRVVNSLPVHSLHKLKLLKLAHMSVYYKESLPKAYQDIMKPTQSLEHYNMRHSMNLQVSRFNTYFGKRVINCSCTQLWNEIPIEIQGIKSVNLFLNTVKRYLQQD